MDPKLQTIIDHHDIRTLLAEYCHACDRSDWDMVAGVYAGEDSFDDHGLVQAPGPEYAKVMGGIVRELTDSLSHIMGQSLIEVDGDEAAAETFFLSLIRGPHDDGTPRLNLMAGRFIDRFVRLDGAWKIKHRTAVRDSSITLKIEEDDYAANGFKPGTRDAGDLGAALLGLAHQG